MQDLAFVILAGGLGTRLWPLSTRRKPKQFVELIDGRSMLQRTYDRLKGLAPPDRMVVLTASRFAGLVSQQLPELPPDHIIGEPMSRDTAAAVTLGVAVCARLFADSTIGVIPVDHMVRPDEAFHRAFLSAAREARRSEALYTFGIRPTYPATGYGYLERGERITVLDESAGGPDGPGSIEHFEVRSFKEKPDAATARRYCDSGNYFWNSGMFVWTAGTVLASIRAFLPQHYSNILRAVESFGCRSWETRLGEAFAGLPRVSIDVGVMEKAPRVRMVRAPFEWADVGGWLALERYLKPDEHGNRCRGRLKAYKAGGNLVFCQKPGDTVALVGVQDLIVVRVGSTTLVADRRYSEEIKRLVADARSAGGSA